MHAYMALNDFAKHMMSKKSVLMTLVPMVSFYLLYRLLGLVPAIVIIGIYGITIDLIYRKENKLFRKNNNLFIYAIVLFGVLELVIFIFVPKNIF